MNARDVLWSALGVVAAAALALPAAADTITFGPYTLSGAQEVPPNGSTATGTVTVILDTVTNQIAWDIEFSGLSAAQTGAHFHAPAPPGMNAGVTLGLPLGSPLNGNAAITDLQEQQLIDGLWYLNIHTTMFPGGEIRAQIAPITSIAYDEAEPNESKAAATVATGLSAGDSLRGTTTGTVTTPGPTSLDTWDITLATAPLGIYRHRLVITTGGNVGHVGTIRGMSQLAAPAGAWPCAIGGSTASETVAVQTSSTATTPPRFNQWYGFGKGERLYYRITGTTGTTQLYDAALVTEPVTPVDIGSFAPGEITITTMNQGHTTDTDLWVYDANLDPIPGFSNDDNSINGGGTGAGLQSHLRRDFAPGMYYLAISSFNLANNLASPCDDDFRTGAVLDFPNLLVDSSTGTNANTTFTITDANGPVQVPATRPGQFDVLWFRFNVSGGPPTDCNNNGVNDADEISGGAPDCFNPLAMSSPNSTGGPDGALDECQCVANWNRDGAANSNDISSYLTSWLDAVAGGPTDADVNCDGADNSNDISAFLTIWLSAVQNTVPHDGCP